MNPRPKSIGDTTLHEINSILDSIRSNIHHLGKRDIENLRKFSEIGSFQETKLKIKEKPQGK